MGSVCVGQPLPSRGLGDRLDIQHASECEFAAVRPTGTLLFSWLMKHTSFAPSTDDSSSKYLAVVVQNTSFIVFLHIVFALINATGTVET